MTNTSKTSIHITRVCLGIIAGLTCMLTACTSDGDAGLPNSAEDRASSIPSPRAGPPTSVDAAAPDETVPQLPITITVDGETFTITERDGGHDYTWDTGLNHDYGFSESAPITAQVPADATGDRPTPQLPLNSLGHYRSSIRDFLAMIDPDTGYIAE